MSHEMPEETKVLEMSREDFDKFRSMKVDSSELQDWMSQSGIEFDSGFVEIEVDGEKKMMSTSKEDFGTTKDLE